MSLLITLGIVCAALYFGKGFFEKVGIFVALYASVLILSHCNVSRRDAQDSFKKLDKIEIPKDLKTL